MVVRVEAYGEGLIDLADDIVDEHLPPARKAVRGASLLMRDKMQRLLRKRRGEVSEPGQPPAEQTGELAITVRALNTTVRGNVISGGVEVGKSDDIPKVQSLEYGAVGDDGRVLKARPFMRPTEESIEAEVDTMLRKALP